MIRQRYTLFSFSINELELQMLGVQGGVPVRPNVSKQDQRSSAREKCGGRQPSREQQHVSSLCPGRADGQATVMLDVTLTSSCISESSMPASETSQESVIFIYF